MSTFEVRWVLTLEPDLDAKDPILSVLRQTLGDMTAVVNGDPTAPSIVTVYEVGEFAGAYDLNGTISMGRG